MIGADTDILFTDSQFRRHLDTFKQAGKEASFFELKSSFGHLGGVLDITQASEAISKFLEE